MSNIYTDVTGKVPIVLGCNLVVIVNSNAWNSYPVGLLQYSKCSQNSVWMLVPMQNTSSASVRHGLSHFKTSDGIHVCAEDWNLQRESTDLGGCIHLRSGLNIAVLRNQQNVVKRQGLFVQDHRHVSGTPSPLYVACTPHLPA